MSAPFFFIIGCGRSGTTLLRAMLDMHSQVAVTPETYFVAPLLRHSRDFVGPKGLLLCPLRDMLRRSGSFEEWQLSLSDTIHRWAALQEQTVAAALADLYTAYGEYREKLIVGDKTPTNVRRINLLASHFPHARFIHIIRDGRQVARSLIKVDFGPNTFAEAVATWREDVVMGRTEGMHLGTRYLEVRYETLVSAPDSVLRAVCAHLALGYERDMLRYHERGAELLHGIRHTEHLRAITQPLRKFTHFLSPLEEEVFSRIAGDLGSDLGLSGLSRDRTTKGLIEATGGRIRHRLRRQVDHYRAHAGNVIGRRPISHALRQARRHR